MHSIQPKESVFTGIDMLIICVPQKEGVYSSYLQITCVCYILLDNRDLQSCQAGQGEDATLAQSTLSVIKQSRD